MNFDRAFEILIFVEGGYVDNPADTGGKTRYGITESLARSHGYKGQMKDFPIHNAKKIYKSDFWDYLKIDQLPEKIQYIVFDGAVNSGCYQCILWLQRALGVKSDGILGPVTLSAAKTFDTEQLIKSLICQRLRFMVGLSNWGVFSKGWVRRMCKLLEGV